MAAAAAAAAGAAAAAAEVRHALGTDGTRVELYQQAAAHGAQGGASAPLVVVAIGDERTGKSSTIASILPGVWLLTGEGSTTRVPTVLNSHPAAKGEGRITLTATLGCTSKVSIIEEKDVEALLPSAFSSLQDEVVAADPDSKCGYSKHPIFVDVCMPGCSRLSIVDLPGLVQSSVEAMAITKAIIVDYLEKPGCIPMLLLPCGTCQSSSTLIRMLADRKFGELINERNTEFVPGPRCLIVHSKADTDNDESFSKLVRQSVEHGGREAVTCAKLDGETPLTAAKEEELLLRRATACGIDNQTASPVVGVQAISRLVECHLVSAVQSNAMAYLRCIRSKQIETRSELARIPAEVDEVDGDATGRVMLADALIAAISTKPHDLPDSLAIMVARAVARFESAIKVATLEHVDSVKFDERRLVGWSPMEQSQGSNRAKVIQEAADELLGKLQLVATEFADDLFRDAGIYMNHYLVEFDKRHVFELGDVKVSLSSFLGDQKQRFIGLIEAEAAKGKHFAPSATTMRAWPGSVAAARSDHACGKAETELLKRAVSDEQTELRDQAIHRASRFGIELHAAVEHCVLRGIVSWAKSAPFKVELNRFRAIKLARRREQLQHKLKELQKADQLLEQLAIQAPAQDKLEGTGPPAVGRRS